MQNQENQFFKIYNSLIPECQAKIYGMVMKNAIIHEQTLCNQADFDFTLSTLLDQINWIKYRCNHNRYMEYNDNYDYSVYTRNEDWIDHVSLLERVVIEGQLL